MSDNLTDEEILALHRWAQGNGCTFNEALRRAVSRRHLGPAVVYMDTYGFGATPAAWFREPPADYILLLDTVELETLAHLAGWAAFDTYVTDLLTRAQAN